MGFHSCGSETLRLAKVLCEEMFSFDALPSEICGPNESAGTNTHRITAQVTHAVDYWLSSMEPFGRCESPFAQPNRFQNHEDGEQDSRIYASGPFWW